MSAQPQTLVERLDTILAHAQQELPTTFEDQLAAQRQRLRGPLRVAIAGKVKAGKSTLLNALAGERLAPTNASECTRIVTWYRDGTTYRVQLFGADGTSSSPRFSRPDGSIDIDLSGRDTADIQRIEVEWPSQSLREITLIDTPGIDSVSTELSDRSHRYLSSQDQPSEGDAVLYLMRHLHGNDVRFLEAFHDQVASRPGVVNAIGVLSRADELGVGRIDAMRTAERIAQRYRTDDRMRRLCQTVVPFAGLLAETAMTLREDEYQSLRELAGLAGADLEALLLSPDRFVDTTGVSELSGTSRSALLDRFGIFGIRLSCSVLSKGEASSSKELAELLRAHSGLDSLRSALHTQFTHRSDVLRARSGMLALQRLVASAGADADGVVRDLERFVSNTHEFAELEVLTTLRAPEPPFDDDETARAERLLGASGALGYQRLGFGHEVPAETLASEARTQHERWQRLATNPAVPLVTAKAARVLVRTCEGLFHASTVAQADPSTTATHIAQLRTGSNPHV